MPELSVDTVALIDRAQRYCSAAEHCPDEVGQILARHGASREQIDEVIDVLKQQNYIDNARYCRAFVHDKVAFQGWGKIKIQMALRAKHLPDTLVSQALDEIDEKVYAANFRKLLQQRRGQDQQKVIRFLLQRGYTFDDIHHYTDYETDD